MTPPRSLSFVTADVFTDVRFGGNQLAVVLDGRGLTDALMLAIAREFNYSETVFVLPPERPEHARRLRIFTPGGEVPFAGHPTVGTAHVLAEVGEVPLTGDETRIVLEEGVGPVPVAIRAAAGRPVFAQLSVAKLPERSAPPVSADEVAAILSLGPEDFRGGELAPEVWSCGLPFLFAPVQSRAALARSRVRIDRWERGVRGTPAEMIMVFAPDPERPGSDLRARMYAPGIAVPEDPATGSACAALAGYLGSRDPRADGTLRWVVEQGFEMGRPSIIEVEADKRAGAITAVRVGGKTVVVSQGAMRVD